MKQSTQREQHSTKAMCRNKVMVTKDDPTRGWDQNKALMCSVHKKVTRRGGFLSATLPFSRGPPPYLL